MLEVKWYVTTLIPFWFYHLVDVGKATLKEVEKFKRQEKMELDEDDVDVLDMFTGVDVQVEKQDEEKADEKKKDNVKASSERVGLITYMRTDSTRVSDVAIEEVRKYIAEKYPVELPEEPQSYSIGKSSQDAHEAIRPTFASYSPSEVKEYLSKEQQRLVEWREVRLSHVTL